MTRWKRRRLRTRILLPFAALILAVLLATLWVVGAAVGGWVEGSLTREFDVTGKVFRALMAERADRLLGETSLLAADFALKRAIATYDPDTLASVADNQRARLGVELLWIADERGRLLASAGGGLTVGSAVAGMPPLAGVMASSAAGVAVTEVGDRLVQVVATPVFAPDPIGYLIAGAAIDDATAHQLEVTTGTHVSFLTQRRVFASSWSGDTRGEALPLVDADFAARLSSAARAPAGRSTFLLQRGDARLLSILVPIEAQLSAPLFVLVQASYDRALGPLAALPEWVSLIGAAALLAALIVGGVIAAGIAAPLQSMVAAMGRVLGGDLSQRIAVERADEVGFLARSFNEMVAGLEEREAIKDTFGRFVSREVATAVLSGRLPLEGERRDVTILFQDVRGFSALSEKLAPDVMVRVVNRLFAEVVAAVEAEGGVIRQFLGDGAMAMFGAPVGHPDDPARAVRAALALVDRLPALNARLAAEELPGLRIGIGIHTGEVIAGRLGPEERSEYGVVGDAVNVASRIEGLTRELEAAILISAATAARLGDEFAFGRRSIVPLRGKAQPIEVVEVLGARAA